MRWLLFWWLWNAQPAHQGFRAHTLEILRQDSVTVLHLLGDVEVNLGNGVVAHAQEAYYTEQTGYAQMLDSVWVRFPWGTVQAQKLMYWQGISQVLFRDSVTVQDTAGRRLRAQQLMYRGDTAWIQAPRLWGRSFYLEADTGRTVGERGRFWRHARLRWRDSTWIRADTVVLFSDTLWALGWASLEDRRFQGRAQRLTITEKWLQMEDSARAKWTSGHLRAERIQVREEAPQRYHVWGYQGAELQAPGEGGTLILQADTLEFVVESDTLRWLRAWPVPYGEYREAKQSHGPGAEDG